MKIITILYFVGGFRINLCSGNVSDDESDDRPLGNVYFYVESIRISEKRNRETISEWKPVYRGVKRSHGNSPVQSSYGQAVSISGIEYCLWVEPYFFMADVYRNLCGNIGAVFCH